MGKTNTFRKSLALKAIIKLFTFYYKKNNGTKT